MIDEKQIEQTILRVAGNPTSGSIAGLAPEMAKQIAALVNPSAIRGKQTRVIEPRETRQAQTEELPEADDQ